MAFRQAKCSNKECASDVYSFDDRDGEENRFCGFCLTKRGHPEHTINTHIDTPFDIPILPVELVAVCYDGIWVVEESPEFVKPAEPTKPNVEPTKPAETPPWGIPEPPDWEEWKF